MLHKFPSQKTPFPTYSSFGVRYRVEADKQEENELRLQQQALEL